MKILFIGNSYTYYNDMPELLRTLCAENGHTVTVDSVTKGGRKLYENLAEGDEYRAQIDSLLAEKSYDILILQEQSYFALVDYEKFEYGVSELAKLVSAKRTILYATWGRKTGCELLTQYGWTSAEMTERLEAAYLAAAKACGGEISPVGRCFLRLSETAPEIELYNPDLSHPSRTGSVLAAAVHYAKIFGELPKECASLGIDPRAAESITEAVRAEVL